MHLMVISDTSLDPELVAVSVALITVSRLSPNPSVSLRVLDKRERVANFGGGNAFKIQRPFVC